MEIILSLVGVSWVFPKIVKEALLSWRGVFVGEKAEGVEVYSLVYLLGKCGRKEIV